MRRSAVYKIYYGDDAVKKVEEIEGVSLSLPQRRVVEEEGFVEGVYKDSKGIDTLGVGQTGKYMDMSFLESYAEHEEYARRVLVHWDLYPEYLQAELMSAVYRGDLQQSPKFRRLLNQCRYEEAAEEFLNHKEYFSDTTPPSIKRRLEKVSAAVSQYAVESLNKEK
jgi:GH24 family phage-related lysozyme (muramidase)